MPVGRTTPAAASGGAVHGGLGEARQERGRGGTLTSEEHKSGEDDECGVAVPVFLSHRQHLEPLDSGGVHLGSETVGSTRGAQPRASELTWQEPAYAHAAEDPSAFSYVPQGARRLYGDAAEHAAWDGADAPVADFGQVSGKGSGTGWAALGVDPTGRSSYAVGTAGAGGLNRSEDVDGEDGDASHALDDASRLLKEIEQGI